MKSGDQVPVPAETVNLPSAGGQATFLAVVVFSSITVCFLFLSNLYAQCGAQIHDQESHVPLTEPVRSPRSMIIFFFF